MDDFIKSVQSAEEAIALQKEMVDCLQKGGFRLTKWICNNERVVEAIEEGSKSSAKSKSFDAEPQTSAILGLQWNVESDTLEVCRGSDRDVRGEITQ